MRRARWKHPTIGQPNNQGPTYEIPTADWDTVEAYTLEIAGTPEGGEPAGKSTTNNQPNLTPSTYDRPTAASNTFGT